MQVHDVDSITEEILIQAPAERIFRALTDPAELMAWWGDPAAYQCTSWVADVRVGGRWRCEGRNVRGGTFTVEGEFTLVEPPRRLGYTWKPSWVETATQVIVELEPRGASTFLRWTHHGFGGNAKAIEDHKHGLPQVVAWLKRYAEPGTANSTRN